MPAILTALLPILGKFLEKIIPDPQAREKASQDLLAMLMASDLAQLDVNKAEATAGNLFNGGWRPFIGWVCGSALAWQFVIAPLVTWAAAAGGSPIPPPPSFDGMLWELLFGMLGMGALRTFEKFKGVAK